MRWRRKKVQPAVPPLDPVELNEAALKEFDECVRAFARHLYEEAGRLEAAQHVTTGLPEITSTMIRDANTFVRRSYSKPRRPTWIVPAGVGANAFALSTGVAATALDKGWGQILFVVGVVGAVLLNTISLWQDR